jgi:UDP-glucose 4-epimerase
VVSAALAAAETEATGSINVGTGLETTVLELVERLRALSGESGFEAQLAPARRGEVQRISIDPARAAETLGWSPQTGLDEGLKLTLDSL